MILQKKEIQGAKEIVLFSNRLLPILVLKA
jgi:hypothetical protein